MKVSYMVSSNKMRVNYYPAIRIALARWLTEVVLCVLCCGCWQKSRGTSWSILTSPSWEFFGASPSSGSESEDALELGGSCHFSIAWEPECFCFCCRSRLGSRCKPMPLYPVPFFLALSTCPHFVNGGCCHVHCHTLLF